MRLNRISVQTFKRLSNLEVDVAPINVVVGGNNSGKSSFLQGVHFASVVATTSREMQETTFSVDFLSYVPAGDFSQLRHGDPYANNKGVADSKVRIGAINAEGQQVEHEITIRRGRNYGNISCDRDGDVPLGQKIASPLDLFSIYVPGLAGVPKAEEYKTRRAVVHGVASGDANLYLRNVLLLLKQKELLPALSAWMRRLFPTFDIEIEFDGDRHASIDTRIRLENRWTPVELIGTGVQQALQIFSYVCLFRPGLLLLDEPDSHLHPNNQYALAEALRTVVSESETRVIASTHSKHLVDALYGDANFIWLKAGALEQQGTEIPRLSLLMDIGALDNFDKLREGNIDFVVLSEDTITKPLNNLIVASGIPQNRFLIYSYKTSSAIQSAYLLVNFIREIAPNTRVIIHRDRDFMTAQEVQRVEAQIATQNAAPLITAGSDIESYYCSAAHVAQRLGRTVQEIDQWIGDISNQYQVDIQHDFTRKRDEIKGAFYRAAADGEPPATLALLGQLPFAADKIVGKFLIKKLRGSMHARFGVEVDLLEPTNQIAINNIRIAFGLPAI